MKISAYGLLPILVFATAMVGCGSSTTPMGGTGSYMPLKVGNRWTYQVTETDGTISAKVTGATGEGLVGGTGPYASSMAFRMVTGDKYDDKNGDVSYQAWVDNRLVRYRDISVGGTSGKLKNEEYYDGPKLRIDDNPDHTMMGAKWTEAYKDCVVDTAKVSAGTDAGSDDGGVADAAGVDAPLVTTCVDLVSDLWTVIAESESVTVPAGTFKAIVLERLADIANGGSDKKFWFARGVGKVKETGVADQTEELSTYTLMQ